MTTIANLLIVALNIAILALNIKLYTEVLKDKSMDRRTASKPQGEGVV